jgi:hypothetical protein
MNWTRQFGQPRWRDGRAVAFQHENYEMSADGFSLSDPNAFGPENTDAL